MKGFAYYNGKFGKRNEISLPLSDRALYFGDGIYELAAGCEGRIFLEDEHIERFLSGTREIGIKHGMSFDEISGLLHRCVNSAGIESFTVYFQMTRSFGTRRHSYVGCGINLLITVDEAPTASEKMLKLITRPDLRHGYCHVKTLNLLASVIASGEAEEAGCDEAVLYKNGFVTECAHSSISVIRDGSLITHPTNGEILPSITRAHLLKACRDLGIKISERPFSLAELYSADEIILTSTTKLCARVGDIDGIKVGGRGSELYAFIRERMIGDCR